MKLFKVLIVFYLVMFPLRGLKARQSFISASFLSDEDESQSSSITLGTSFLKKHSFSFDYTKAKFESDDEEIENKSIGLNYDYRINNIFSFSIGASRGSEPEYITTRGSSIGIQTNLNHLWGGLYLTSLYIGSSRQVNNYKREFTQNTVDQQIEQQSTTVSFEQEMRTWLVFGVGRSQFSYDTDPSFFPDTYPVLIQYMPEFESMLYSFPETSEFVYFDFQFNKWGIYLGINRVLNYINQDYDETWTSSFAYYFDQSEIAIGYNKVKLYDSEYGQVQLKVSYYF